MAEVLGHGSVGKHEQAFTHLLALRGSGYDPTKLAALAAGMAGIPDKLSDGSDPEENSFIPAGYTYFGQFIDHDLTFDTTSTLSLDPKDLADPDQEPTSIRSPRFDLDCVYGNGPGDAPYLYFGKDGSSRGIAAYASASLLLGGDAAKVIDSAGNDLNAAWDLQRGPNGRALIGDKRNDENSIVNQIQQLFISYHNKIVETLAKKKPALLDDRNALFQAARDEVRWTYHKIIVEDFLPRLIDSRVLDEFQQNYAAEGEDAYILYTPDLRSNLPREFVAAAYRYGHSGVRQGYRLNAGTIRSIFLGDLEKGPSIIDSLVGFDPLPSNHVIDDWARFFPLDFPTPGERRVSNADPSVDIDQTDPSQIVPATGKPPGDPAVRLQYAYKLDPSLVEPLINLPAKIAARSDVQPPSVRAAIIPPTGPSLALLNLLRGNRYGIQSGQAFEPVVGVKLDTERYLRIRTLSTAPKKADATPGKKYTFVHIRDLPVGTGVNTAKLGDVFTHDTPLWLYILAEAQKPVVDLWYATNQQDLSEEQLLGQDENGNALPATDPPDPAEIEKQLAETGASGTRLGDVGGRIVAEVFYGLLDSDNDSLFNRAPGKAAEWEPLWTSQFGAGTATMAKLIAFAATPENGLKITSTEKVTVK